MAREYCILDLYDAQGRWLDSLVHVGTRDVVALDLRRLAGRATALPCRAIVARHAHPSGNARPSAADIATTRLLASFAAQLGLVLHDHVIEARAARFSFRAAGLL